MQNMNFNSSTIKKMQELIELNTKYESNTDNSFSDYDYGLNQLWRVESYTLTEEEKEIMTKSDKLVVFKNLYWFTRNSTKLDDEKIKYLGMHVWAVHQWIKEVEITKVFQFLIKNNFDGHFMRFIYNNFVNTNS